MDSAPHRNSKGQFGPGNPGGPGGSRPRRYDLRKAAEEALTPELVSGLVRKLAMLGFAGNVNAAKVALEYTCGRPADASSEPEPLDLALPKLRSAAKCNAAIDKIIAGISDRTVDLPTAKFLLDAVLARLKAIDSTEHEKQLAELEEAFATVAPNGAGRS